MEILNQDKPVYNLVEKQEVDTIKVEVYVDHHTVTVVSGGEPVATHASNSYSVAGDSVHESWSLNFTIEKE